MRNKIRKACLQMIAIGIGFAIILFMMGHNVADASGVASCLFVGLLYSPVGWALYRFALFLIFPAREPVSK